MKTNQRSSLTPFNSEHSLGATADLLSGQCPELHTNFVDDIALKLEQAKAYPSGECDTWSWHQTCDGAGVRFDFDPAFGKGFSEIIDLGGDVFLRVRNSVHRQPYSVWSRHEGDVILTILLSGGLSLGVQTPEGSWIWAPFALAGFNAQPCIACSSVAADVDVHLVTIIFRNVAALTRFGFPASAGAAGFLERIATPSRSNMPSLIDVGSQALSVAQDIIDCPFQGAIRRLYMAGKARELACYVFSGESKDTSAVVHGQAPKLDQATVARLARARIDSDLSQTVAGDALAAEIGVSRNTVMRAFKAEYGKTVGQYAQEARLKHACRLLEETSLAITEVAFTVGYDKPGSFSDAFRQAFRCTPSQYRKSQQTT